MTPAELQSQTISEMADYYRKWAKDIRDLNGHSVDADHADKTATVLLELRDERDQLLSQREFARAAHQAAMVSNEQSRSVLAPVVTKLKMVIQRRSWMTEGRGPYEWNDDGWRDEFGEAMGEWMEAIKDLERVAADWSHCPTDTDEIMAIRELLQERTAAIKAKSHPQ